MTPAEMVREYWNVQMGPDTAAMGPDTAAPGPLTIFSPPPPAPARRIPGWLLLGSAGLVAWWFLGFKRR
jgi:hypothetical protein